MHKAYVQQHISHLLYFSLSFRSFYILFKLLVIYVIFFNNFINKIIYIYIYIYIYKYINIFFHLDLYIYIYLFVYYYFFFKYLQLYFILIQVQ